MQPVATGCPEQDVPATGPTKNTESKTASSPNKKLAESKYFSWAWQLKNAGSKTASSYEPAFG